MARSARMCWTTLPLGLLVLAALTLSPTGGWASPTLQPTVNVSALDNRFDPQDLRVLAGTTVVWTNGGIALHTATSSSALWDSGIISGGGTFSHTFNSPGSYPYFCTFHQLFFGMSGTITVVTASNQLYLPFLAKNSVGW